MSKIMWYLKQLLPLTYRSHYDDEVGRRHVAIWVMWFGRVFSHEDHVAIESSTSNPNVVDQWVDRRGADALVWG